MTKISIIFFVVLLSFNSLGQKPVKLKIKTTNTIVNYVMLPEIISDKEHETLKLSLSDEKGKEYDCNYNSPTAILKPHSIFRYSNGNDYEVILKRLLHKRTPKKAVMVSHNVKVNQPGKAVETINVKYYYYKVYFSQDYKIVIKDNLDNGRVVFDSIVSFNNYFAFPNDVGPKNGYKSKELLKKKYDVNFLFNNNPLQEPNPKSVPSIMTRKIVGSNIKKYLIDLLACTNPNIKFSYFEFKTKDRRFEGIDSIDINFKKVAAILAKQKPDINYINGHSKEVYELMNANYKLIKRFNTKEYLDLLEIKEEYKHKMRYNTFLCYFYTSKFSEALGLYDLIIEDYNEEKIKNQDNNLNKKIKLTPKHFCYTKVYPWRSILLREQRLYNKFKKHYKFYK
jgi:hypothetical protein